MGTAYLNGKFLREDEPAIPIDERGHQFGDGVYEVIRIYNNRPFMLEEHLNRLYQSMEAIRLTLAPDRAELQRIINELIEKSGLTNLDLYIQVTRGIAPRNHLFPSCSASLSMTAKPFRSLPSDVKERGASVRLVPDERWENCYIKSLNLLPNILAKQTAYEHGCLEAVMIRNGLITEGSSSNVYMVKDSQIITTPLSKHILAGITRIAVQQLAKKLDIPFVERSFTPDELLQADEVFITSTTSEVAPVVRVDEHTIHQGTPGAITRSLQEQFQLLTQSV